MSLMTNGQAPLIAGAKVEAPRGPKCPPPLSYAAAPPLQSSIYIETDLRPHRRRQLWPADRKTWRPRPARSTHALQVVAVSRYRWSRLRASRRNRQYAQTEFASLHLSTGGRAEQPHQRCPASRRGRLGLWLRLWAGRFDVQTDLGPAFAHCLLFETARAI